MMRKAQGIRGLGMRFGKRRCDLRQRRWGLESLTWGYELTAPIAGRKYFVR